NSANGEALFYGKAGCGACHMIRDRGGYLGPDLSNAGIAHRVSELRTAILNPALLSISGYKPVLLAGGVRGIVKNESNWSMQVIDESGQIHLLHGAEMKSARLQPGSWMPADYARRLAPSEIDDIVAFLSRQREGAVPGTTGVAAAQVTDQDLRKGPDQNWLTYIGDYAGHRYS